MPPPPRLILDWTGFYGVHIGEAFKDMIARCPEEPHCTLTSDKNMLNRSQAKWPVAYVSSIRRSIVQAILFHLRDMDWDWKESIPDQTTRSPEQIYVLFSFEPPSATYASLSQAPPMAPSFEA